MKRELLDLLRCPACGARVSLGGSEPDGEVASGSLACASCARTFPVAGGVPRFASDESGTSSFGLQWQRFQRTQLDSHTRVPISRDRFFSETRWTRDDLRGALVLDAGCGAGRFAEVALDAGATLVAIDASNAVDACASNLARHPRIHIVQADIYHLPFAPATFDFVYSLGVLQHTPDVERAFKALVPPLKPDGRIAVDLYPATPLNLLWPKYWLRPITRRVPAATLFGIVEQAVPWLLPVSLALGRIPRVGARLRYAVPVANYERKLPLSAEQIREWAVLDTFDMLAPAHDHPQSVGTLRRWFEEAGLAGIDVARAGVVIGRGRKPR